MNNDFILPPKRTPKPVKPEPVIEEETFVDDPLPAGGHESLDFSGSNSEDNSEEPYLDEDQASKDPSKPKKTRRNPKQWFMDLTKKQKIIFCVAAALALILIIVGLVFALKKEAPVEVKEQPAVVKKEEKPKTVASNLSGEQIDPELNKRGVVGVIIENSLDARPQSGLQDAGIVYEAIAEGGITRFLALFQDRRPDNIGPVRSVRPYYVDWIQAYDAPIVHAGGSEQGLSKIRNEGVKDIDHSANGGTFDRSPARMAPHDLYTTSDKLDEVRDRLGYTESAFKGFARKKDEPSKTPTASSVHLGISSPLFNVSYAYDAETNSYLRTLGGEPHIDTNTNKQLSPKVVIAIVMQQGYSAGYTTYNSLGTGPCLVFQDGIVINGTWIKSNSTDQMEFKDERGETIKLNAGQTWISTISTAGAATYTP